MDRQRMRKTSGQEISFIERARRSRRRSLSGMFLRGIAEPDGQGLPFSVVTHFQGCHKRSDQTAMSRLIESYGTVGFTFPRGVFVFMSSTTPNCSRIARSAETFFTSLMTTFANA